MTAMRRLLPLEYTTLTEPPAERPLTTFVREILARENQHKSYRAGQPRDALDPCFKH